MDVPEHALDEGPMDVPGIVHVEARLLDGIGDVGARERQVLKSADDAAVERRIVERTSVVAGQLGLGVHGCGCRFAILHAGAF